MLKHLAPSAMLFVFPVHAQQSYDPVFPNEYREYCEIMAGMAEAVMGTRQVGVPYLELLNTAREEPASDVME